MAGEKIDGRVWKRAPQILDQCRREENITELLQLNEKESFGHADRP